MQQPFQKLEIMIRNSEVAYWTYGNPKNPAVLLVHGFRGNHVGLIETANLFKDQYVIIPDLPGYGASKPWTNSPHTITAYAQFLHDFCEAIHIHHYTLIGYSFGALLAILFAQTHNSTINKLILISPVLSSRSIEGMISALYYNTARILPQHVRRAYLINQITDAFANTILTKTWSLKKRLRIICNGLKNIETFNEHVIMENFISLYATDPFAGAQHITIPVLIISGMRDRFSPRKKIEELQRIIPHAQCAYIPREGHLIPLEQPTKLYAAIASFIDSSPIYSII